MIQHPTLSTTARLDEASRAVEYLVAQLQTGLDQHDADIFNDSFAADVIWGGPYGATVSGYGDLHRIHQKLHAESAAGPSRYQIVAVTAPAPNVALAQVRRTPHAADDLAEMALYVLVCDNGRWWLAAGQNTLIQPGRSATDNTESPRPVHRPN
jgi:uncharacterized protein (TIGR02246 family)